MRAVQHILVVEDNPDDVFFLRRAFRKRGLDEGLTVLSDGQQAIDFLSRAVSDGQAAPLPSLVLLDLQLPFYTGLQILEWARHRPVLREVPFIVLSSSSQRSDMDQALELGARAYHVKPSNPDELHSILVTLERQFLPARPA
jgi:CheY-like chemotaxis protein